MFIYFLTIYSSCFVHVGQEQCSTALREVNLDNDATLCLTLCCRSIFVLTHRIAFS